MPNDQPTMVLPVTHLADGDQEQRLGRRRAPALALAALCAAAIGGAAVYTSGSSEADQQASDSAAAEARRLEVEEGGENQEQHQDVAETSPTAAVDVDENGYPVGIEIPPVDLPEYPPAALIETMETEVDPTGGSLIAAQFGPDPYANSDHMQMILDGKLNLADIRYVPHSFTKEQNEDDVLEGYYDNIYGDFCAYDMNLNKENPTGFPGVRDIMGQSRHCGEHRYSLPLREVINAVLAYDAQPSKSVRSVPVTGILLHEGRSGATVISNALAVARPESTRVISEHPAILEALQACDRIRNKHRSEDCRLTKQQQLLKDVVMLLSRTPDTSITNLYLKMQSTATPYLSQIRSTFPDAKWAFFYRDADVALAKATQRKRNSCVKQRRSPSIAMRSYAITNNIDLEAASQHEICAMHLATLISTAFDEYDSSGTGMLVSYDDAIIASGGMSILDTILPYLGIEDAKTSQDIKNRVIQVVSINANARGQDKKWNPQDDLADVTDEVKSASEKYLKDETTKMSRGRN